MNKLKQFIILIVVPLTVTIVAFFGNFFFVEYQETKANVLLNESRLTLYNEQLILLRTDLKKDIDEIKEGQKQIINILLKERS